MCLFSMFSFFFDCWLTMMEDTYLLHHLQHSFLLCEFTVAAYLLNHLQHCNLTFACMLAINSLLLLCFIFNVCFLLWLLLLTILRLKIFVGGFLQFSPFICWVWWKILIYSTICSILSCFGCLFTEPSATLQPHVCTYACN